MEYLAALGRAHVVVLHLPFGLLAGLVLLELLALRPGGAVLRPALRALLWLLCAVSALAASTGFILSREPGYTSPIVERHMWLGLAFAGLTLVAAVLHERWLSKLPRPTATPRPDHAPAAPASVARTALLYRLALLACIGLLFPTGHLGGTLTHGEDFLFEPLLTRPTDRRAAAGPTTTAAAPAADMFATSVLPTFESHCYACHGPTRSRGKLALHTPEGIRAGGESGPVIVPGDPAASEMLRRLRLPLDDLDHMPPEGKPQPTPQQIAAIEAWIAAGAPLPPGGRD